MENVGGTINYKDFAIIMGIIFFMIERLVKIIVPLLKGKSTTDKKTQKNYQQADPNLLSGIEIINQTLGRIEKGQQEILSSGLRYRQSISNIETQGQRNHDKITIIKDNTSSLTKIVAKDVEDSTKGHDRIYDSLQDLRGDFQNLRVDFAKNQKTT